MGEGGMLLCPYRFYRTMLRRARYCYTASRLSVTLRYRHRIGWNSSKIISRLLSLRRSRFPEPNIYSKRNTMKLPGIGGGCGKSGFQPTKALISLKLGQTGPWLLLRNNRKSRTTLVKRRNGKTRRTRNSNLLLYPVPDF